MVIQKCFEGFSQGFFLQQIIKYLIFCPSKAWLHDIFDVWDAYIPSSGISGNFDSLIMDVGVRKRLKF